MNVAWTAAGAVAGLPGGTVLRGQVCRLSVRSGEPDEAACADCATPLPAAPALRCAHCGSWLGAPAAIELVTAAVTALLFARFGEQPALVAFAYFGMVGVALAQIDVAAQRLPDRLTLPAYPALILLLSVAAAITGDGAALVRSLLGGLALGGGYLLLGLVSGGQLGGGDIKLAGLAGLLLGWLGWPTLVIGTCLGFVLAAIVSLALLAGRKISAHSMISFGPYLLGGALLAVLAR
jgi:leader peptidase (prepilin peptidase) / N-methyltransferase